MKDTDIAEVAEGCLELATATKKIEIKSEGDAVSAAVNLKEIKDSLKRAEELRKTFTQPLNKSLKAINAKFKEATAPLKQAEVSLKRAILTWRGEENRRIVKEEARRRKLQEAHFKKGHDVNPLIQMERVDRVGTTSTRKVKKWRLIDFGKLSDEYKVANDVLLNKLVRGGKADIPGIEIYEDEVLSVR